MKRSNRVVVRPISLSLAALVLPLTLFALTPAAAGRALPSDSAQPAPSQTPTPEADKIEAEANDVLVVVRQIRKPPKPETAPSGPPAKQDRLEEEARIRAMFLEGQIQAAKEARARAEKASNPAERQVLLKDAQIKLETAASVTRSITGPPPEPASPTTTAAPPQNQGSRIRFSSGALDQLKRVNEDMHSAAENKDVDNARQRSIKAYGDGRAGAGGVALYKTATMLTPLDHSQMGAASFEDGRLVLIYGGRKLKFPSMDPQFIALAMRSVYGGEGLVKGTLLANENNAVVLRTGKDLYGDVVWKKEFLPSLPSSLTVGQEIALEFGPGVGVLSLPEPSHDRVTYYGPLKGNLLGQVVQESDMVFSMFWYGVDWKTGRPLDPTKLAGYESAMELALRQPDRPPRKYDEQPAKNWWDDTVWYVWTPDEISLKLSATGSEFEFVKTAMKVTVWSVVEANVDDRQRVEGTYLTEHYDDLARAFPILAQLREAASATAVVRWLKENKVAVDLNWAQRYPLAKISTPDTVQRFAVYVHRDKNGKPLVENGP